MEYTIATSIAAGLNNAGGLALITSLSASSIPFVEVSTMGRNSYGELRTKANSAPNYAGFREIKWKSSLMWLPQFASLRSTYEGAVTIRTPFEGVSWANYNAYLSIGSMDQYDTFDDVQYGWALIDVIWTFSKVQAI